MPAGEASTRGGAPAAVAGEASSSSAVPAASAAATGADVVKCQRAPAPPQVTLVHKSIEISESCLQSQLLQTNVLRIFTTALPEFWLYVLGLLFILVTLFMPHGVVGVARQWKARRA